MKIGRENLSVESMFICSVLALACAFIVRTLITSFFVGNSSPSKRTEQGKDRKASYESVSCAEIRTTVEQISTTNVSDTYNDNKKWRCACEAGFLPPGLLKSFGNAESVIRLGTGQCYHKQT
mmetsp:Transcript_7643/g.11687  ORF Transcript_7643/g.11687 Transcript_7643/m.11687 type:complete len:122 (-) Transcript_7643:644-1009(-)